MFYLPEIFRTSDLGDSISSNPERTVLRRWGGGGVRLYRSLQQGAGSPNIKRLLLIKEMSQVKEFSAFLCMEDARVWAYWNHSVHRYLSYLGPASCIFLHPWFLEVSGGSIIAVGPQVFFSFMGTLEDWNHWWLFILVYWYNRKYCFLLSISFLLLFWFFFFFFYSGKTRVSYKLVGEGNGTPLQYSCLENPMDGGAW